MFILCLGRKQAKQMDDEWISSAEKNVKLSFLIYLKSNLVLSGIHWPKALSLSLFLSLLFFVFLAKHNLLKKYKPFN